MERCNRCRVCFDDSTLPIEINCSCETYSLCQLCILKSFQSAPKTFYHNDFVCTKCNYNDSLKIFQKQDAVAYENVLIESLFCREKLLINSKDRLKLLNDRSKYKEILQKCDILLEGKGFPSEQKFEKLSIAKMRMNIACRELQFLRSSHLLGRNIGHTPLGPLKKLNFVKKQLQNPPLFSQDANRHSLINYDDFQKHSYPFGCDYATEDEDDDFYKSYNDVAGQTSSTFITTPLHVIVCGMGYLCPVCEGNAPLFKERKDWRIHLSKFHSTVILSKEILRAFDCRHCMNCPRLIDMNKKNGFCKNCSDVATQFHDDKINSTLQGLTHTNNEVFNFHEDERGHTNFRVLDDYIIMSFADDVVPLHQLRFGGKVSGVLLPVDISNAEAEPFACNDNGDEDHRDEDKNTNNDNSVHDGIDFSQLFHTEDPCLFDGKNEESLPDIRKINLNQSTYPRVEFTFQEWWCDFPFEPNDNIVKFNEGIFLTVKSKSSKNSKIVKTTNYKLHAPHISYKSLAQGALKRSNAMKRLKIMLMNCQLSYFDKYRWKVVIPISQFLNKLSEDEKRLISDNIDWTYTSLSKSVHEDCNLMKSMRSFYSNDYRQRLPHYFSFSNARVPRGLPMDLISDLTYDSSGENERNNFKIGAKEHLDKLVSSAPKGRKRKIDDVSVAEATQKQLPLDLKPLRHHYELRNYDQNDLSIESETLDSLNMMKSVSYRNRLSRDPKFDRVVELCAKVSKARERMEKCIEEYELLELEAIQVIKEQTSALKYAET